eukprot:717993-Hanusia_phi.AAC.13
MTGVYNQVFDGYTGLLPHIRRLLPALNSRGEPLYRKKGSKRSSERRGVRSRGTGQGSRGRADEEGEQDRPDHVGRKRVPEVPGSLWSRLNRTIARAQPNDIDRLKRDQHEEREARRPGEETEWTGGKSA